MTQRTSSVVLPDGTDVRGAPLRRLTQTRGVLIALGGLYAVLLNWSYANVESVAFAYQGILFRPPPSDYTIASYFIAVIPLMWLPLRLAKPSHLGLWVLFITFYVPAVFFPYHVSVHEPRDVLVLVLWIAVAFASLCFLIALPNPFAIPGLRISPLGFDLFLLAAVLAGLAVVVSSPGFEWNLDLATIYVRRLAARETIPEGGLRGYLTAMVAVTFAPLALARGLVARRWFLVVAGTVSLLAIFALTGTKSSLVTPLMVPVLYVAITRNRAAVGRLLLVLAILGVTASSLAFVAARFPLLSASLTRRVITYKGVSTAQYWDYFQDNPVYMKDSGIMRFLGLPQERAKTFIIGEVYDVAEQSNADANAWASSFANFGYLGFLIATFVAAAFFKFVDACARHGQLIICAIMVGITATILGEMALETTLLNGGLLSTGIMLFLLPSISTRSNRSKP